MPLRRTAFAAVFALSLGLTVIVLLDGGFSTVAWVRLAEMLGVVITAGAALLGAMAVVGVRMAGWQEPESEEEFERVVLRAERLARDGTAAEPEECEFLDPAPYEAPDFGGVAADA